MAIKIFEKQEKTKGTINKVNSANELFIKVMFIHIKLVAIRQNYYENVNKSSDPRYRWMKMPSIMMDIEKIEFNLSRMSFIATEKTANLSLEYSATWQNVIRIGVMIANYNHIGELINIRNGALHEFESVLLAKKIDKCDYKTACYLVGEASILRVIQLTEHLILVIDDILIEVNSFLKSFPQCVLDSVDSKLIKNHESILSFTFFSDNPNKKIKRVVEVDYQIMAKIFNEDEAIITENTETFYNKRAT